MLHHVFMVFHVSNVIFHARDARTMTTQCGAIPVHNIIFHAHNARTMHALTTDQCGGSLRLAPIRLYVQNYDCIINRLF